MIGAGRDDEVDLGGSRYRRVHRGGAAWTCARACRVKIDVAVAYDACTRQRGPRHRLADLQIGLYKRILRPWYRQVLCRLVLRRRA